MKRRLLALAGAVLMTAAPVLSIAALLQSTSIIVRAAGTPSADLAAAIRAGDLDAAKAAIAAGADVNALDDQKMPPISSAARLGKVDILNYLGEKGADVNRNDGAGFTPLMNAAIRGQSGAVKALLKLGADPALKGQNGNDAVGCARPSGPADPLYEGKSAALKVLTDALAAAKPAPKPGGMGVSASAAVGSGGASGNDFGDYHFMAPDAKVWKRSIKEGNLVFSSDAKAPAYCDVTLHASRDFTGDSKAFTAAFDAAVAGALKARGVGKADHETSVPATKMPHGGEYIVRQVEATTKDGDIVDVFVAIHLGNRFEMIAVQDCNDDKDIDQALQLVSSSTVKVGGATESFAPPNQNGAGAAAAPEKTSQETLNAVKAAFAGAADSGNFDDYRFKIPDKKLWKDAIKDNNLVFSAALPAPDFCEITLFASRDLKGDTKAFSAAFDAAVNAQLKAKGMVKIENDSGDKPAKNDTGDILMREMTCEAKDFHTCHYFLALHTQDRFELVAFQTSGSEMYEKRRPDAIQLLESMDIVVTRELNAPGQAPKGGLGQLIKSVAPGANK